MVLAALTSCSKETSAPDDPGWDNPGSGSNSQLVVMSYNIRHCAPYYGTSDMTVADVEGTAAVIKSKKPDVVMLQEVDKVTTRSLKIDQAQKIAQLAGYPYYQFFKLMDYQGGEYGLAILSQKPLKDAYTYALPSTINNVTVQSNAIVGSVTITVDGNDITLLDTHLSVYQTDRDVQMPYIAEHVLAKISRPVILAGDFNATPDNATITTLDAAGYTRTNTDATKYTIPSNAPNRQIDYISYYPKNKFSVVSHLVLTGISASDHLPIISVLKIEK